MHVKPAPLKRALNEGTPCPPRSPSHGASLEPSSPHLSQHSPRTEATLGLFQGQRLVTAALQLSDHDCFEKQDMPIFFLHRQKGLKVPHLGMLPYSLVANRFLTPRSSVFKLSNFPSTGTDTTTASARVVFSSA